METISHNPHYKKWLVDLKSTIKSRQLKAAVAVNSQLILLYWELGKMIVEKQESSQWGAKLIGQIATDLKTDLPNVKGFSRTNLYNMRQFYLFYRKHDIIHQAGGQIDSLKEDNLKSAGNQSTEIVQQPVGQIDSSGVKITNQNLLIVQQAVGQLEGSLLLKIPWGHHVFIISQCNQTDQAIFYLKKTIENNWSRAVLEYQIETDLFNRQGKAISNFKKTLPKPDGDLARELLKNPYNFDFLNLSEDVKERDLEQKLVENITQFLLELGKGFAYMGKQFLLKVGNKEYRTDLLFYHTKLKAYVVIELKVTEFKPEFIGKLNFYISAINEFVKEPEDKPSIGILLCKNKDNFEVEFSLKDIHKPIGVSEFTYRELPEDLKKELPTAEEFNNAIKR